MIKESCHIGHNFVYKGRGVVVQGSLKKRGGYINGISFAPASLMVNLSNIQEAMTMQILIFYCVQ